MRDNGLIIYFDGPDGVGKTTQLRRAAETIEGMGRKVYQTQTLGGTPIGEALREVFISNNDRPVETDLHMALAIEYALATRILMERAHGRVVLVDRSPLSIIGYQVYGDGLSKAKGYAAATELMELIKPDAVLIYYAEAGVLEARRQQRNHHKGTDFFEDKPVSYHQATVAGFKEAARHFQAIEINASESIDEAHEATMKAIRELF